jgi:hypothetical protein
LDKEVFTPCKVGHFCFTPAKKSFGIPPCKIYFFGFPLGCKEFALFKSVEQNSPTLHVEILKEFFAGVKQNSPTLQE